MARLGLQLYTVMDDARRDLAGTVRRIGEIGYKGVEFPGGMRGMASGAKLKIMLEENNLDMAGIVFRLKELEDELEDVARYCRDAACDTIVVPWIDDVYRSVDGYAAIAGKFNSWGLRLKAESLRLLYHVHGYEFQDIGGTTGMEVLMANMDPAFVNLEIDVYWVEHGGQDAVAFMQRYGNRSPCIHFKDMTDRQSFHDTEVGAGCIDMAAVASIGIKNAAEWFIVEQEAFDMPPLESVEISLGNLRRIAAAASQAAN
jgi:sugar phosphate isomerase/epimerase